jgi:small subunit ribosomal protein S6e
VIEMADDQVFKGVVNDTEPKAKGKAYAVDISGSNFNHFIGRKIGDVVDGLFVGEGENTLSGYKLEITGGSDRTGRPMRPDVSGGGIYSILVSAGVGYKGKRYVKKRGKIYRYKYDGIRRRRNLRGNIISQDTRQLNLKVIERGPRPLDETLDGSGDDSGNE